MTTLLDHSEAHLTGYLCFCLFVCLNGRPQRRMSEHPCSDQATEPVKQLDSRLSPKPQGDLADTKDKKGSSGKHLRAHL